MRYLIWIRDLLHISYRLQARSAARLDELRAGSTPTCADEAELCWQILALSFSFERELTQRYCEAAGLECEYV